MAFNFVRNESQNQFEAQFAAVLKSISPETVGQFPSGKYYRVGSVEFTNAKGIKTTVTAIVNEANFEKGMTVGESYLCTAIIKDGRTEPLITCSHLVGTSVRATADDFGFKLPTSVTTQHH